MTVAFELNDTLDRIVSNVPADRNGKYPTLDTIVARWTNPHKLYDCFDQGFFAGFRRSKDTGLYKVLVAV